MTADVLDTDLVGMHGDVVPAYSAWEWLSRLFVRFLGPQNDAEPSLSTPELMEEFRDWTVERTTPPAPSDPDVTPVEAPSFPISQALYDNAFRTDLREVLGLDREVVLAYDVSVHQGAVDHRAFREAGYTMGICKATEGGSTSSGKGFLDKRFKENWAAMEREGLIRTAYHFARVSRKASDGGKGIGHDAENEALWFLDAYGDEVKPGMLPPVLDIEWDRKATAANITADEVLEFCVAFVETVKSSLGVTPIVYTGPNFWRYRLKRSLKLAKCPLWIVAGYTNRFEVSKKKEIEGWDWFLHQHTNKAKRPDGGKGGIDANYFRGSLADLRRMAGIPDNAAPNGRFTPPDARVA